ncbi:MAG: 2OG-Fe(II) oxygenase [Planctomycetales bacterium]|nr:2OG-Fe(II) oxygenase [Planctomycetales bacterium]
MNNQAAIAKILGAIEQTSKTVAFCTAGVLDLSETAFDIQGMGAVKLPLRPKDVRELLGAAERAPYGKGTQTLVDTSVRDSLEVDGGRITLPQSWTDAIHSAAAAAAASLGMPAHRIQATLYKLLIYPKGGFFLPHRDSEKRKNMVGSMVVMLPSAFGGGELVVEHNDSSECFQFNQAARGESAEYVVFYADCLHEVRRVTRGVRVCLHFNLTLQPERTRAKSTSANLPDPSLAAALSHWVKSRPGVPLVFALEHLYTERGLKPDLLKGNDRLSAKHLIAAAKAADCRLQFGRVSRHLQQFADDGSFQRGRHWHYSRVDHDQLSLGEVYEDELFVDQWTDVRGKRVVMGPLPLDASSVVSPIPIEKWKPTRQDFEGYTGNAGNTLDRWYHKSAIVVWAATDHDEVFVKAGIRPAIEVYLRQIKSLETLRGGKLERAQQELKSLARAIVNAWPERHPYRRFAKQNEGDAQLLQVAETIPGMNDPELLSDFLRAISERDSEFPIDKLVANALRFLDKDAAFAALLDYLNAGIPPRGANRLAEPLPARDATWLIKLASSRKQGGLTREQLTELCRSATRRFCDGARRHRQVSYHDQSKLPQVLTDMLKAALAAEDTQSFQSLLSIRRELPDTFNLRDYDVPTCCDLVEWADRRVDKRPPELDAWLAEVRQSLQEATTHRPEPPGDFTRPNTIRCWCASCRQLAEFLGDPAAESGSIRSRKDELLHVEHQIRELRLDVESELNRNTRPFALTLKKTTASHLRAVEQYVADLKRLSKLPTE